MVDLENHRVKHLNPLDWLQEKINPQTVKEMYWTILLIFYRLYLWTITLTESKLFKKDYKDAWERVQSTK